MKIAYPATFEADADRRVLVKFRDLPEAATDGADVEEARREAVDLLESALMFRMKYREDIPAPSRAQKGEELVTPDAAVAMKAALYLAMRQHDVTAAELSRRLGIDNREAQRVVNPFHATKTARMSEAIEAVGGHAIIELRDVKSPARKKAAAGVERDSLSGKGTSRRGSRRKRNRALSA